MNSSNKVIKDKTLNNTEENKLKEQLNNSIRNKIFFQKKNNITKLNNNPIRIINNKSSFQIKPKKKLNQYHIDRNIPFFNLKKIYDKRNEDIEVKDDLIIKLYHTTMEINKLNKEIKELQNLFDQEKKENLTHKYIINRILQENQNIKLVDNYDNYDSPKKESIEEENKENKENNNNNENNENNNSNDNINKSKNDTIKISYIRKEIYPKDYYVFKNRTIPNSIKKVKTRNLNKLKIDTLKKGLDFYQRMIESREEKLKNFKKMEGPVNYNVINTMIDKKNKIFENLSKKGGEMRDKLIDSDEKIFELNQKISKIKEKNNKSLAKIVFYKNKISEIEFKINLLTEERTKRQKEELQQENEKSKEESEIKSLINEKNNLEEEFDKKKELKLEEYDYKRERENLYNDEKKYKLKNDMYLTKLEHCKNKNEELNQKIKEYEEVRDILLEKSKMPRKNKIKIEEMENEFEQLLQEVEDYEKKLISYNKINEEKNKLNKIEEEQNNLS